jgi:predicted nucleotidyltransferase
LIAFLFLRTSGKKSALRGSGQKMLRESFEKIQKGLVRQAKLVYGRRLISIVLYGSAARGTQRFDSDLDCLLVCKDLPRGRMRRIKEFERVEDSLASLLEDVKKKGMRITLSPIFKTPEEVERGSPVFLDMVEDAVILHDKEDFFAKRLARLRERLAALGAKRIWRGNAWYWDLKPDFRPGEIFEL